MNLSLDLLTWMLYHTSGFIVLQDIALFVGRLSDQGRLLAEEVGEHRNDGMQIERG